MRERTKYTEIPALTSPSCKPILAVAYHQTSGMRKIILRPPFVTLSITSKPKHSYLIRTVFEFYLILNDLFSLRVNNFLCEKSSSGILRLYTFLLTIVFQYRFSGISSSKFYKTWFSTPSLTIKWLMITALIMLYPRA